MVAEPLNGAQVRERRARLGLTQPALAALAGVSDETLRKVELDRHVGPTSLRRIRTALTSAEVLTSGHDPVSQSDADATFDIEERGVGVYSGRNVIRVKAAALGVEVEVTYDGPEDRAQALSEALAAIMQQGGDNGAGSGDAVGGGDAPAGGA